MPDATEDTWAVGFYDEEGSLNVAYVGPDEVDARRCHGLHALLAMPSRLVHNGSLVEDTRAGAPYKEERRGE